MTATQCIVIVHTSFTKGSVSSYYLSGQTIQLWQNDVDWMDTWKASVINLFRITRKVILPVLVLVPLDIDQAEKYNKKN